MIEDMVTEALNSVFRIYGSQARLVVRGIIEAIVTKIWGHENIASEVSLGDLYSASHRSIFCEFITSGTKNNDGKEVESLKYIHPNEPNEGVTEQITLFKDVERCYDDKQTIAQLIRLAKNMQEKFQDESVDRKHVYHHKAYLGKGADADPMS